MALAAVGVALAVFDGLLVSGAIAPWSGRHGPGCGGQAQSQAQSRAPRAAAGAGVRPGLVWLHLRDGREQTLVTADPAQLAHPAVSPDGAQIAFLSHSNGIVAQLAICDLHRATTHTLRLAVPAGDFPLSWDWNGKTLVFLGGDTLGWGAAQRPFLVEPSGARLRPLAGNSRWYYDGAVLSPDGSKLALLLQWKYPNGHEPEQLAVLDLRAGTLTRVAGSAQVAEIDDVSWSPDGRRIAFSAYRDNAHGGLYVVDLATRRVTPLLVHGPGARAPAWSPDGRSLAFVRGGPRSSSIWLLDLADGRVRRLTRGGIDVSPAWAPNGKALVFVRRGPAA